MKKIITKAEVKRIVDAEQCLNAEWYGEAIESLNRGDADSLTKCEKYITAIYLVTREINVQDRGGEASDAREICNKVDAMLKAENGYTLGVIRFETTKSNRYLIAELNMGLNHITLTENNPYAINLKVQAI